MMGSYTASHGDFLLTGEDFCSEGILSRLRNRGVNACWMPVLLRDLAPGKVFKEFGKGHKRRIRNLQRQAATAREYGIKLYLYLNEPRYMPEAFFENHPSARGMRAAQHGHYGLCTSEAQVREWVFESIKFVFSQVPGLGGIILITASEHETNCYSHISTYDCRAQGLALYSKSLGLDDGDTMCPRCEKRGPEAVLCDMADIAHKALDSIASKADVIQWLWSWDYIMPLARTKKAVTNNLPAKVKVMIDWQRRTQFKLFGREAMVDEYTLAYTKPSDYALEIIKTCKKLNRKVVARCALVSTVEMNAQPYLPVLDNVEKLLKQLRKHEVEGFLGCWVFGAYPGRNMEVIKLAGDSDSPTLDLARKYYGPGAGDALSAWKAFSRGMKYFPTAQSVLYHSGLNAGPGLNFSLEPETWRSGLVLLPTEDIEKVSGPLGAGVMIKSFRKTAEYFSSGLKHLKRAVGKAGGNCREENTRDYNICHACLLHLLSVANYSEFIILRNKLLKQPGNSRVKGSLIRILKDEDKNTRTMLGLVKKDSRIGYEGSYGYFYTPVELLEKIFDLRRTQKEIKNMGG